VDNTFFTKNEETLRAKHLEEHPYERGPEANASFASPRSTTTNVVIHSLSSLRVRNYCDMKIPA